MEIGGYPPILLAQNNYPPIFAMILFGQFQAPLVKFRRKGMTYEYYPTSQKKLNMLYQEQFQ